MADKKQGKNKKYGRNKKWCQVYTSLERHLKNKLHRLQRHMRRHPADKQAVNRYRSLTGVGQHGAG